MTSVAPEAEKRLRSVRTLGLFLSIRCYRHAGPYGPEEPGACRRGPVRDPAIPNYSYVMLDLHAVARTVFFFARHLFRSFRTLMSIEKLADSFSRSVRTLITRVASEAKKRLRSSRTLGLFMSVRCYRHLGPYGPKSRKKTRGNKPPRYDIRYARGENKPPALRYASKPPTPSPSTHRTSSTHDWRQKQDPATYASLTSKAYQQTKLLRSDSNTQHQASLTYP